MSEGTTTCTALAVRMWGPRPQKSDPKWVNDAIGEALRFNEVSLFSLPDRKPVTRNDHRQRAIWILQEAVRRYSRYLMGWSLFRHHAQMESWERKQFKPCDTKKEIFIRLDSAWRYYQEWL